MSMVKRILHHIKDGTLITTIRKKKYVRKNIYKDDFDREKYLIGLGEILVKYKMNLKSPQTFNEKINYYKLHYQNPLMYRVVDKIEVKEYIKENGFNDILIETIAIYDNIEKVDLKDLPNSFVIKNTLDSGGVFICKDKSLVNINQIKKRLQLVNQEIINGRHWALEQAYKGKNRIIVESLLETSDGHAPTDYKFFCFDGEPKFLFVGTEREKDVKFDFFDIDFNWINVRQGHKNNKKRPTKPRNFDKMLQIARGLSKGFPHVRVDLYNIEGKIYFGELTFYHFAALTPFKPYKYDVEFGKYFNIDLIKKSEFYVE